VSSGLRYAAEVSSSTSAPERYNFAAFVFGENRVRATKTAYVDDVRTLSYGELEDDARRFAAVLAELGVRAEERIVLFMLDTVELPVAFLGALFAGVVPVLVLAVAWLYWQGSSGWATALLVWTIFVGTIDNVIRPILIQKGAQLPLLLVVAGVIGGLISFGLVGIFVGPVVLGVSYMLFEAWLWEETEEPAKGTL